MSKLTIAYPFAQYVLVGDVIVTALKRHPGIVYADLVVGVYEYDEMIYVQTEDGESRSYYLDEPVTVVRVV